MKEKKIEKDKGGQERARGRSRGWVMALTGAVLAGAALIVYFYGYWTRKEVRSPQNIQEHYKRDLPELKKKAEGGNAADLQNYAIAQYATGDAAGAEQTYRKQIQADPQSALAHNNLANALRDQRKYQEAAQHYEKAMEISPAMLSAYVNLGSVYQYSLKDMVKAAEVYERGIKNNPNSADLYMLLAILKEQVGDKEDAAISYRKVLEINPAKEAAKAALERLGEKLDNKKDAEGKEDAGDKEDVTQAEEDAE
ncbi:MAG TPA: tetratricopeptide repeat protein [Candidatus Moranbacteria bacterium]|nr:tetratricopeptide repeat protein [Candidatus Moranbacteria bacterium]